MLDTQLFYMLNSLAGQSPLLDFIIVFCASYLAYILIGIFAVFLLCFVRARREQIELFIVALVSVMLTRGLITELIRFFVHRQRPFEALALPPAQSLLVDPAWSFPSGHATFFFALSTAVYLYNKKWGIGFFALSIVMTLGRVTAGLHYPSDIIAGAVIGVTTAYIVYRGARKIAEKGAHQTY